MCINMVVRIKLHKHCAVLCQNHYGYSIRKKIAAAHMVYHVRKQDRDRILIHAFVSGSSRINTASSTTNIQGDINLPSKSMVVSPSTNIMVKKIIVIYYFKIIMCILNFLNRKLPEKKYILLLQIMSVLRDIHPCIKLYSYRCRPYISSPPLCYILITII